MQSKFRRTEVAFAKLTGCVSQRIADAVVDGKVIEFQHSYMDAAEAAQQFNDYGLHGRTLVWVVDGNEGVEVSPFAAGNLIKFNASWKHASFLDCAHVFLNVGDDVYRFAPRDVKSEMVIVREQRSVAELVDSLEQATDIWDASPMPQCTLFHSQQGAGVGKTFKSVQLLNDAKWMSKTTFVYLTKQHTAKVVIFEELMSQIKGGHLEQLSECDVNGKSNQYRISWEVEGVERQAVIGTVDSFMVAIGNKDVSGPGFFTRIVESVASGVVNTRKNGAIRYAQDRLLLNKECMIVIDEAQDLGVVYLDAIVKVMAATHIDVFLIGDKMQSILGSPNVFTHLETNDLPNVDIVKDVGRNLCRRFRDPRLAPFVNSIVPFNRFGLPAIEVDATQEVDAPHQYFLDKFEDPRYQEVALRDEYWASVVRHRERYHEFVRVHRSDEGKSIDLLESEHAARILSIHASKGSGRAVVFVLGLEERVLRLFSDETGDLKYESLIHVAVTRMKRKLYLGIGKTVDDVRRRLDGCEVERAAGIRPLIYGAGVKLEHLVDAVRLGGHFDELNDAIRPVWGAVNARKPPSKPKPIVDMGHHLVRSVVFHFEILKNILNHETVHRDDEFKDQFLTQLRRVARSEIQECRGRAEYNDALKAIQDRRDRAVAKARRDRIPMLLFSFSGREHSKFQKYEKLILDIMRNVKRKIVEDDKRRLFSSLCPLEATVLMYMLRVQNGGQYNEPCATDLYNLVHCFAECFASTEHESHSDYGCKCNEHFGAASSSSAPPLSDGAHPNVRRSIAGHYEVLCRVRATYQRAKELVAAELPDSGTFRYNIDHYIRFRDKKCPFRVSTECGIIGQSDKYVLHIILKPQLNELNFFDVMLLAMYQAFCISSTPPAADDADDPGNRIKYHGKRVFTCVVSMDTDEPTLVELPVQSTALARGMSDALFDHYSRQHRVLHEFYIYCRTNKPSNVSSTEHAREEMGEDLLSYVRDYFYDVEKEIRASSGQARMAVVERMLDNREQFAANLDEYLRISIADFMRDLSDVVDF
ncbi:hypothetical protein TSOC_005121 [Tetrabaena socialis]|uniref:DNA helicase n=1 Tax=Tetrabaena socialis TaxID=47790 RepID=A0A2J8A753_9CHLO|nr:hypothetical protein TSOC_005121 [Tetrabaena socialis]|eukprot:PNH08351.1 hypothetical protein TSOC_005121 [Tetrabaena socialis]